MSFNKTIQMYIFNGDPNGRIMCELSNWNGRVYKISRNELAEFSKRDDAENTGAYFLFGKNEENIDTIYIGEAEKIFSRLKQHLKDEDYWNDCITVISKDNILNKAHVKFLEYNFYSLAKQAERAIIINNNIPTCSSVSEYDEAMLQEFISNTQLLVNTLGYKVFSIPEKHHHKHMYFYIKSAHGAEASGVLVSDGFTVLKGSKVSDSTAPSISPSLKNLRDSLIEQNIIDQNFTFTKDKYFTSPSLAAAVVMGRNANGRTEWKNKNKQSIKDLETKI